MLSDICHSVPLLSRSSIAEGRGFRLLRSLAVARAQSIPGLVRLCLSLVGSFTYCGVGICHWLGVEGGEREKEMHAATIGKKHPPYPLSGENCTSSVFGLTMEAEADAAGDFEQSTYIAVLSGPNTLAAYCLVVSTAVDGHASHSSRPDACSISIYRAPGQLQLL